MTNPFADPAGADIVVPGTTPVHKFPLPPETRDYRPKYNHLRQYLLPDIDGAGDRGYTRVTTGAKTLDDTAGLERWKLRSVVRGLKDNPHLLEDIDLYQDPWEVNKDLERAADKAHEAAGGVKASEFGTAIHAWCEAVELGHVPFSDVPPEFAPFVEVYFRELAKWGITHPLDPSGRPYVERIVYNPETGWVGTFDNLFILADGSWVVGDKKTAKDLAFSYLAISIQLGDYAGATHILSLDGTHWEPMPKVRQDIAVVLHIPSNAEPAKAEAVTIELAAGRVAIEAALRVREMRTQAKNVIPNMTPIPRPGQAVEARPTTPEGGDLEGTRTALRQLIRTCSTAEQLAQVYDQYAEIWTDELTALGQEILSRRAS
ncbi:hypothetical protein [Nocardia phage NS-I]|nr:hypothetical protein [Nocardia phage NS-I]